MQLIRPTLLLNENTARNNIKRMSDKAKRNNMVFRPHFKTHFSAEIGAWYREEGVKQCTVSCVEMANYFFLHGWEDITIAFPCNRREIETINKINDEITLNVLIEDLDTLGYLQENVTSRLNYFIKVDLGTHRTGLPPDEDFSQLILSNDKLRFRGFLTHAGHTYTARSHEEIKQIYERSLTILKKLKTQYIQGDQIISYGDTPSCSVIERFETIDEIRPGNFIFYDWMQYNITSCGFEDIAVCLACPIVAKHAQRNELVIHGGAVHLSKDAIEVEDQKIFGTMVVLEESGWQRIPDDPPVVRLSQEHGIVKVADRALFNKFKVGDVIGVIPIHSCLTANLMGSYLTTDGKKISQMNKHKI